jgi:hypothetical protein
MEPVARLRNHAGTSATGTEIRPDPAASDVVRRSGRAAVTSAARHHAAMRSALRRYLALSPRTAVVLSAAIVLVTALLAIVLIPQRLDQRPGVDFSLYRDVTIRWLDGGPYFELRQLAGPYEITPGDVLYPPVAIWLFTPFALATAPEWSWLGAFWWLVPLAATTWSVIELRPRPWAWPLIALCVSNPTVLLKIWTGNPVMWSMAALAMAAVGPWRLTAPFVLLKPSLGPFAAFGANRRSWWLGFMALVLLSLPFGAMWRDWLSSVVYSRGGGLLYSSLEVPFLLLPLVAWLGRTRRG